MKVILIGHPDSQHIVKASSYLTHKYLGTGFDIIYLNYEGPVEKWSEYLADYFSKLDDKLIIFVVVLGHRRSVY
ncbi:MAG: hypothetical protein AAB922_06765, partial [Patescibacteria group bacterium]